MKRNSGKAERLVRFGLGLLIAAIGLYTILVNWTFGLFVLAVGAFTVFEGVAGWTLLRMFDKAPLQPDADREEIEFFS